MMEPALPDEVWWLILSYVVPESILICAYTVCKTWGRVIRGSMTSYTTSCRMRLNDDVLARMPMLRRLDVQTVSFCCTDSGLAMLSGLTALKLPGLIRARRVSSDVLVSLPGHTKLTILDISGNYRVPSIPNLLELRASANVCMDDSVVSHFTTLRSLYLCDCPVTDNSIALLTNLTSLSLTRCRHITNKSLYNLSLLTRLELIGPDDRIDVSSLTKLRSLCMFDVIDDEEELFPLNELRILDLPNTYLYITRAFLTSLTNLSSLTLAGLSLARSITRQDLTHLVTLEIDGQCYNTNNANNFRLEEFYDDQ